MKFYYVAIILFSTTFPQTNCRFFIEVFANYAKQTFLQSLENINQTQCSKDLKQFAEDVSNNKPDALKMLDAGYKLQSGIFQLNTRTSGDYDQCLSLSNGQYCAIHFEINSKHKEFRNIDTLAEALGRKFISLSNNQIGFKHSVGVCVPNSCAPQHLKDVLKSVFLNYLKVTVINCVSNEVTSLSLKTLGATFFFMIMATLLFLSTIYDLKRYKSQENKTRLLTAFSLYSNSRQLFSCKTPEDNLGIINGIRSISLLWIILGHTTMHNSLVPSINYIWFYKWKDDLLTSIPLAASIGVDTFFTLSGMLMVYVYLTTVAKGYKVSMPIFFLHRFLRLSPALYAMVIFYAGILESAGDGPYWFPIKYNFVKNCEQYWWSTMLYIQSEWMNECVTHAWYLVVDTQLYIMSPLVFFVIRRSPTHFLFGTLIAFLISSTAAFITTVIKRVGSASLESSYEYFVYIYRPTYIRMMPWLVGLVWGYFLFKYRNRSILLSKSTVVTAWVLSISTFTFLVIIHICIHRLEYNVFTAALFNSLARAVWGVCVGWVIFACANGYGGFINAFLSNPVFTVTAKLNYSMYLVHYPIVLIKVYSNRHPIYLSNANHCLDFLGIASLTIIVSIFWTLSFELPIGVIEKSLLHKYVKIKKADKSIATV